MSVHWEVRAVKVQPGVQSDKDRLAEILQEESWEPFAVTWGDGCAVYHLRKLVGGW